LCSTEYFGYNNNYYAGNTDVDGNYYLSEQDGEIELLFLTQLDIFYLKSYNYSNNNLTLQCEIWRSGSENTYTDWYVFFDKNNKLKLVKMNPSKKRSENAVRSIDMYFTRFDFYSEPEKIVDPTLTEK
jgi:hypothetical protein